MNYKINNLFFNFTSMSNVVNSFWITPENLEKSQRQVPIYAVKPPLDGEQKIYVQWDMIPAKYLTVEQLDNVNEALSFDAAVAEFQTETAQKAYLCL